ncbi:TPA: AAA family ATPase, partial [Acinetobacter baumannii]|nr:AAA family ATPase [Acinetobacter baumannii]
KTAENSEIFQNSDDILILENNFHGEKNTPNLNKSNHYFLENIFLFRPSYRYESDALEITSTDENFHFQVSTKAKADVDYPFPFKIAHSGYNIENLIIELFLDMHIGYQDSGSAFSIIPKILNKITNKDYGNFQISRHPYRRLWSSTKGMVTSLSQGELDLLVTISSIIARQLHIYNQNPIMKNKYDNFRDIPGLVIIDEVDLHLHPRAQETYIETLTSMFKNVQFLVTTHSPFVIRGLPEDSIVIQLPTGITIKESFSMMDIDSITNFIFNYDGRFSIEVENDLKIFKKMISQFNQQDNNLHYLSNMYKKYRSSPSIINELDTYLSIFSSPDFTIKITGE